MKIAVMQPYFFPYLGYFQLINAVDKFVFYDDVNYIKGGWINRNKILGNNKNGYFTLKVQKASSNKLIKDIKIGNNREILLKTIYYTYSNAPYFKPVYSICCDILKSKYDNIAEINVYSIQKISQYLNLKTSFYKSSSIVYKLSYEKREDRIISICNLFNADKYINMLNGQTLYDRNYFQGKNIELLFLHPVFLPYRQFKAPFREGLSVIDALMFNNPEKMLELVSCFKLK